MRPVIAMFALLLSLASLDAAPPKLKIDAEVRPSGQYVDFVPETDAVSITYVGLDGIDPVPSRRLAEKTAFLLDTYGKPAKKYRFAAVASSATGEQARVDFVVVIGTPAVEPPPIKPGDPKDPPVVTPIGSKFYFVIVRSNDPAPPAFEKEMRLQGWADLRKDGHKVKDMTLAEATKFGLKIPDGTVLPFVAILSENPVTKVSTVVKDAVAYPFTDDGIKKLPEAAK